MPSKYSHSAVLAGYSSRGLINLSNDQHVGNYESTQITPIPEFTKQTASSVRAQPQHRAPVSGANSLGRYAASSEQLPMSSAQKQRSAALYHEIHRRLILDSDSDGEDSTPNVRNSAGYISASPSTSRSRSVETSDSQPRREIPPASTLPVSFEDTQSNAGPNYYASQSKTPRQTIVASSQPGPTRSPTECSKTYDTDEERSIRSSSDVHRSEAASTRGGERHPPPPPSKDAHSDDYSRPWPPTMLASRGYSDDLKELPEETTPRPNPAQFKRHDSAQTVLPYLNENPLPDNADFDGFADTNEPDFIRRLVVTGRGTTSSARRNGLRPPPPVAVELFPRAPPPPSVQHVPPQTTDHPPRSPSRTITQTSRSASRTSMTSSVLPQQPNPTPSVTKKTPSRYTSVSSFSSHRTVNQSDTLHTQSSQIGVPSIVRSPSMTKSSPSKHSKRHSRQLDDTDQHVPTKPNLSVQHRQQYHHHQNQPMTNPLASNPLSLPEIPRAMSLRGSFARTSFFHDDDLNTESDSDSDLHGGNAAPAPAVHLQSKRDSLLARNSISILATSQSTPTLRPQSRLLTHLRDPSSDVETTTITIPNNYPNIPIRTHKRKLSRARSNTLIISTPIVFTTSPHPTPSPTRTGFSPPPPDIAKYRVRNGLMSPLAQLEMIRGSEPGYGAMSREEKVREAEGVLLRGRGGAERGKEKEKDGGGGFWGKLRERSKGRKRK